MLPGHEFLIRGFIHLAQLFYQSRQVLQMTFPMLCECSDPDCRAIVMVRLEDFHAIRRGTAWLSAPDHMVAEFHELRSV